MYRYSFHTCVIVTILSVFLVNYISYKMSKYSIDVYINEPFSYSRGALFDKQSSNLYFVDAVTGEVIKHNTVTKNSQKRSVEANLVAAIPLVENDDHLLVVGSNKLYRYVWSTGELIKLQESSSQDVYMTASIDSNGRLWIGTMDLTFRYGAGIYCLQSNGELVKKIDSKSEVTSIVWSPDNQKMYISDSGRAAIFEYDFEPGTGDVSNEKEWISFAKRGEFECSPDFQISSMANLPLEEVFEALSVNEIPGALLMTKSGSIWVCCYHTGRLVRLNATNGSFEEQIELPALTPMSMVYSGDNGEEIIVLTVASFITENMKRRSPEMGKVFRVRRSDATPFDYYVQNARFALTSVSF